MRRLLATSIFGGLALCFVQCGGSSLSSSTASAKPARVPSNHFATPPACAASDASTLGPDCTDATQPGCACTSDGQCTGGPNGVCVSHGNTLPSAWCEYDVCVTSNDCSSGSTCLCSGTTKPAPRANQCVPSNCRSDSDCGASGFCSPSIEQPEDINCQTAGHYGGAYCHTPQDDCTDDADCGGGASYSDVTTCAYDLEQGKWTCQAFHCLAG